MQPTLLEIYSMPGKQRNWVWGVSKERIEVGLIELKKQAFTVFKKVFWAEP
jgi:hypothetical protein